MVSHVNEESKLELTACTEIGSDVSAIASGTLHPSTPQSAAKIPDGPPASSAGSDVKKTIQTALKFARIKPGIYRFGIKKELCPRRTLLIPLLLLPGAAGS